MTLRTRLALGLLTIAVLLVVPLLVALHSLQRLHRDARALRDGEFASSLVLGRVRESLSDLRQRELALLVVKSGEMRDAMESRLDEVSTLTDSLDKQGLSAPLTGLRGGISEIRRWLPAEYDAVISDHPLVADSISAAHVVPAIGRAEHSVLSAEAALREKTAARVEAAANASADAERLAVVALVLALMVAAGVAVALTRSISHPVRELERGMRAVADGELEYRLPIPSSRGDEFGRLAQSFDEMTQQLAALDQLKAEFVSVASHELKTPINVIGGYVELLQEGIYGPLTDKQREIHGTIDTQVKSLGRLVRQLLDVSRFEAGGGKLDVRTISLGEFLDDLERAFHVLSVQRGVRFEVYRDDALPGEVTWDPDRMNEVLGNLLSNAFKFTPRGGEVDLSATATDDHVRMTVRDSGAGIAPAQLPHIFEKFYQADNQAAATHAGSGLGLAIAKQIVEAHKGTIECESTPEVGTTFIITLPRTSSARRISLPYHAEADVGA